MKTLKTTALTLLLTGLLAMTSIGQGANLKNKADAAYRNKDYKNAAVLYVDAAKAGDSTASNYYNAACSYALADDSENAFKYLELAVSKGFLRKQHVLNDSDLKTLRDDPRWKNIVDEIDSRVRKRNEFWDSKTLATGFNETLTQDEMQAGLAKVWSEAKFNFVNFDLVPDLNWDATYVEFIPKVRKSTSTLEYYKHLMRMVARLKDGHCNVYLPNELKQKFYARPALETARFGKRVYVTRVHSKEETDPRIEVGTEILAVEGMPVLEYAREYIAPLQSASTDHDRDRRTFGRALLAGDKDQPIKVRFAFEDGKSGEVVLKRFSTMAFNVSQLKDFQTKPRKPFEYERLEGGISYVALNSFGTDRAYQEFMKKFEEIRASKGLIIDLRNNGGGNSSVGWNILGHLTQKAFLTSKWHTRQYRPAFRAWQRSQGTHGAKAGLWMPTSKQPYLGPVVVLTSHSTFSAAEDFAVAFDVMNRGKIVGQPTGGSTGQPLFFRLPGGGGARVTTKRDSYPDGKEFVGIGVQPDIKIEPTVSDLIENKDSVLEKGVLEIKRQIEIEAKRAGNVN